MHILSLLNSELLTFRSCSVTESARAVLFHQQRLDFSLYFVCTSIANNTLTLDETFVLKPCGPYVCIYGLFVRFLHSVV